MEKRRTKMSFHKSGDGYYNPKANIPITWARILGFSEEDKEMDIILDNEKKEIIIRKAQDEVGLEETFVRKFLELSNEELEMLIKKRK